MTKECIEDGLGEGKAFHCLLPPEPSFTLAASLALADRSLGHRRLAPLTKSAPSSEPASNDYLGAVVAAGSLGNKVG